jgi:thiol-disulfide isomerase/thioredoxin
VIPWVREWYDEYKDDGLTVIGVHYPEFNYEKDVDNVKEAAAELGVTYPIAIDNEGLTWRAYNQHYWPTRYLLDKNGHIRYTHIGEGAYEETELVIKALLAEPMREG